MWVLAELHDLGNRITTVALLQYRQECIGLPGFPAVPTDILQELEAASGTILLHGIEPSNTIIDVAVKLQTLRGNRPHCPVRA